MFSMVKVAFVEVPPMNPKNNSFVMPAQADTTIPTRGNCIRRHVFRLQRKQVGLTNAEHKDVIGGVASYREVELHRHSFPRNLHCTGNQAMG